MDRAGWNHRVSNAAFATAFLQLAHIAAVLMLPRQAKGPSDAESFVAAVLGVAINVAASALLAWLARAAREGRKLPGLLAMFVILGMPAVGLFSWAVGSTIYYGHGLPWWLCLAQVALALSWILTGVACIAAMGKSMERQTNSG